jgi:hypothetical protein
MERKVVSAVRDKHYDQVKVDNEVRAISRMLLYVESFEAFCNIYEVFDADKRKVVTNRRKLRDLYTWGVLPNDFLFKVSRN